ncbi:MAG: hypothetical protein Q4B26_04865 [Eubacteriales bacterium]|nr:hypothetical protein [Eubacteriales bacterium]
MKVFISQPMNGQGRMNIEIRRSALIEEIKKILGEDIEIIDSIQDTKDKSPLECLSESIRLLATADVVYFDTFWEKARGCRIEHECAVEYGKMIIDDSQGCWMQWRKL